MKSRLKTLPNLEIFILLFLLIAAVGFVQNTFASSKEIPPQPVEEEPFELEDMDDEMLLAAPFLAPPLEGDFYDDDLTILNEALDSKTRPIAQLLEAGNEISQINGKQTDVITNVYIPELTSIADGVVGFQMLSSIRYEFGNDLLLITVSRPSAEAGKYKLLLGNQMLPLENGHEGWLTQNMPDSKITHQISYQENDLIITIASSLPEKELILLANQVTVAELGR